MKTSTIILIVVIVSVIVGLIINYESSINNAPVCEQDSDCIMVFSCCDERKGQFGMAINKEYKDMWERTQRKSKKFYDCDCNTGYEEAFEVPTCETRDNNISTCVHHWNEEKRAEWREWFRLQNQK